MKKYILKNETLNSLYGSPNVYYLHPYTPHSTHRMNGTMPTDIDKKIMDIKSYDIDDWKVRNQKKAEHYFYEELSKLFIKSDLGRDYVICRVPRSKKNKENHIYNIGELLCDNLDIENGLDLLHRYKDCEEAHISGNRDQIRHLNTIKLLDSHIIRDRHIILLDDVITSGNTMDALCTILNSAKPKSITCIAIGKTT